MDLMEEAKAGSLIKWIPDVPGIDTIELSRLPQLLEVRRGIVDRIGSHEEMAALAEIHEATVEQLDEQLTACEHSRPWQVRRWRGQRAKAAAAADHCRRIMRQCELEIVAWHSRFISVNGGDSDG